MAKEIVGLIDINSVKEGLKKYPGFMLCADLYVKNLVFTWEEDEKSANITVGNRGLRAAGSFLIYFNLEENPVSQNHRPQERLWIVGIPAGGEVTKTVDFTHLAHANNSNLANVTKLVVEIDPKDMVNECDETNNSATRKTHQLDTKLVKENIKEHLKEHIKEKEFKEIKEKEVKEHLKEIKEKELKEVKEKELKEIKEKDLKEMVENPKDPREFVEKNPSENLNIPDIGGLVMHPDFSGLIERLNVIEEKLGKAFISKDERPDVGEDILKKKK